MAVLIVFPVQYVLLFSLLLAVLFVIAACICYDVSHMAGGDGHGMS